MTEQLKPDVVAYLNEWSGISYGGISAGLTAMSDDGIKRAKGADARVISSKPLMTVEQHHRIVANIASASHEGQAHGDGFTAPEVLASRLIDIWIENHGRQIPWAKAVEIIALVTNQPRQETDRLLAMDDVNPEIAMRAEIERLTSCLLSANKQAEHFEREWYLRGDALEDLSAEVEALRKDAERYRWLKACNSGPIGIIAYAIEPEMEMDLVEDRADSAIDAAMEASK